MRERREPETLPGPAQLPDDPDDDFTLPAALWWDAVTFWADARRAAAESSPPEAGDPEARFARAAVVSAFMSLEASLNQAAFAYAATHRDSLEQITRDVLEERETGIDDAGRVERRPRRLPAAARRQFLVRFMTGRDLRRDSDVWRNLEAATLTRDRCVHPKPPFGRVTHEEAHQVLESVRAFLLLIGSMMADGLGKDASPLWLKADYESFD